MKLVLFLLSIVLLISCDQPDSEKAEIENEKNENSNLKDVNDQIPVEAYVVKKEKVQEKIPFTAILKPLHEVDIVSESSGEIIKINKQLGNIVSKNDILAIIDDVVAKSNLEQAKAQVLTTENNLKIAELNLKSDMQLFENGDISKLQYDNSVLAVKTAEANHLASLANMKLMQKQFDNTRIESPIKGIVARKFVEIGEMVNPSAAVYRVVDLSTLKLQIGVPQNFISNIQVGDSAEVRVTPLKNEIYRGSVKYISPQADETTGAFMTEIHVKNTPDQKIKAGMSSKVNLILKTKIQQEIVPNHAIITKDGEKYIYKISKDKANLLPINVGETYGNSTIVEKGIAAGDTIIVVGMKKLGLETAVWIETLHNQ